MPIPWDTTDPSDKQALSLGSVDEVTRAEQLSSALTAGDWRPLPPKAENLLVVNSVPPRLAAHLRLVHDVAYQLAAWIPVSIDAEAALFGAATHDLGKTLHPNELSGPGHEHEEAGYQQLKSHGVDDRFARFARTHASWATMPVELEDLLVSLADKVWKAKRVQDLEEMVVARLAGDRPTWEVFMELDDELTRIAAGADDRLAFQSIYPV
jgi:putative nucleotidyltransferase with HDIG domain